MEEASCALASGRIIVGRHSASPHANLILTGNPLEGFMHDSIGEYTVALFRTNPETTQAGPPQIAPAHSPSRPAQPVWARFRCWGLFRFVERQENVEGCPFARHRVE